MIDSTETSLSTAQIGSSGVLLIPYKLLKRGIDSAAMTTDAGVDLVAYAPKHLKAVTIQVKTCLKPRPAGGNWRPALDWWLNEQNPAQLIGLANLAGDQAWIFRREEFSRYAQQNPEGRLHLTLYVDDYKLRRPNCHVRDFTSFLVENRVAEVFGTSEFQPETLPK